MCTSGFGHIPDELKDLVECIGMKIALTLPVTGRVSAIFGRTRIFPKRSGLQSFNDSCNVSGWQFVLTVPVSHPACVLSKLTCENEPAEASEDKPAINNRRRSIKLPDVDNKFIVSWLQFVPERSR